MNGRQRGMGGRDEWDGEMNGIEGCMGWRDEWEGEMNAEGAMNGMER
jgi:hypothetical protein